MLTKDQRAAIRARCEAATLGPWELLRVKTVGINGDWFLIDEKTRLAIIEKSDANADFIVHARQDIPALLDALEDAEAENEALFETHIAHEAAIMSNCQCNYWKHRAGASEKGLDYGVSKEDI